MNIEPKALSEQQIEDMWGCNKDNFGITNDSNINNDSNVNVNLTNVREDVWEFCNDYFINDRQIVRSTPFATFTNGFGTNETDQACVDVRYVVTQPFESFVSNLLFFFCGARAHFFFVCVFWCLEMKTEGTRKYKYTKIGVQI